MNDLSRFFFAANSDAVVPIMEAMIMMISMMILRKTVRRRKKTNTVKLCHKNHSANQPFVNVNRLVG